MNMFAQTKTILTPTYWRERMAPPAPAKLDFQPIGRRQRIMADQAVFVGWNVEKLLTILNF